MSRPSCRRSNISSASSSSPPRSITSTSCLPTCTCRTCGASAASQSSCVCSRRSIRHGGPRAPNPRRPCAMSDTPVVSCRHLAKTYTEGPATVEVLLDVNLAIAHGERVAIIGASATSKSTLQQLMGGLDTPTQGEVWLDGIDMRGLNIVDRGRLRYRALGFVYQFHHLLPEFTALENVCLPLLLRGVAAAEALAQAELVLFFVVFVF